MFSISSSGIPRRTHQHTPPPPAPRRRRRPSKLLLGALIPNRIRVQSLLVWKRATRNLRRRLLFPFSLTEDGTFNLAHNPAQQNLALTGNDLLLPQHYYGWFTCLTFWHTKHEAAAAAPEAIIATGNWKWMGVAKQLINQRVERDKSRLSKVCGGGGRWGLMSWSPIRTFDII